MEKPDRPLLILASQSPARKAILAGAGLDFVAVPAHLDERALEAGLGPASPGIVAIRLAEAKAVAVSRDRPEALVIGADQTLAVDGELLHKAASIEAVAAQLQRLRGRTHRLTSAVAIARGGRCVWSHAETADLTMRAFSDAERDRVLRREGEAILDSVGGYRLEGPSVRLFDKIAGDYFTILGLPLLALLASLRHHAPQLFESE